MRMLEEPWRKIQRVSAMCDQKAMAVLFDKDNIVAKQTKHKACYDCQH